MDNKYKVTRREWLVRIMIGVTVLLALAAIILHYTNARPTIQTGIQIAVGISGLLAALSLLVYNMEEHK